MTECPVCKFENSPGRRFCHNCGSALLPAAVPVNGEPPSVTRPSDELASVARELELTQQQLAQARQESAAVAQQLKAREEELDLVRRKLSQTPVPDNTLAEQLKHQLDSANAQKEKLAQTVASLQSELEKARKSSTGGGQPRRLVWPAVGSLLLASITAFGGFKYGQVDPDKAHRDKLQTLNSQIADQQDQFHNLESQLTQSRQNVDQLTTQVTERARESQDATSRLSKARHDLTIAQASLTASINNEKQLKQELQSARQNVTQLNQELVSRSAQLQALQQVMQKHPAWTALANYSGPTSGVITWEGERSDKTKDKNKDQAFDVVFEPGRVTTQSGVTTIRINGELPRVPVVVQGLDKGVFVALPPTAKNGWARMIVHVEGKNHVVARISWAIL
jgi:predicted  nucleic acid-binding Zn-ribbon protein